MNILVTAYNKTFFRGYCRIGKYDFGTHIHAKRIKLYLITISYKILYLMIIVELRTGQKFVSKTALLCTYNVQYIIRHTRMIYKLSVNGSKQFF